MEPPLEDQKVYPNSPLRQAALATDRRADYGHAHNATAPSRPTGAGTGLRDLLGVERDAAAPPRSTVHQNGMSSSATS